MRAIETTYAGCRFRSRLEARWAVFFDELGVPWRYEPQGFEISDGFSDARRYLPDFWLPEERLWVEVKGELTVDDLEVACIASYDERGGLPLDPEGTPAEDQTRNRPRVLLLTDVPRVRPGLRPAHVATRFHKGAVEIESVVWTPVGLDWLGSWSDERGGLEQGPTRWLFDDSGNTWTGDLDPVEVVKTLNRGLAYRAATPEPVAGSYAAARSARFEHDERRTW